MLSQEVGVPALLRARAAVGLDEEKVIDSWRELGRRRLIW